MSGGYSNARLSQGNAMIAISTNSMIQANGKAPEKMCDRVIVGSLASYSAAPVAGAAFDATRGEAVARAPGSKAATATTIPARTASAM